MKILRIVFLTFHFRIKLTRAAVEHGTSYEASLQHVCTGSREDERVDDSGLIIFSSRFRESIIENYEAAEIFSLTGSYNSCPPIIVTGFLLA